MPYEVSMCGGGPWGFRMGGGAFSGKPVTISRITPGGKAAQANVMQGDVLIAVNGMSIQTLPLPDVMQLIKDSGEQVHLTLLSQEEASMDLNKKRQSEANITTAAERERPLNANSPLPPRFKPTSYVPIPEDRQSTRSPIPPASPSSSNPPAPVLTKSPLPPPVFAPAPTVAPSNGHSPCRSPAPLVEQQAPKPPVPKPRLAQPQQQQQQQPRVESPGPSNEKPYKFPDQVKRQLKPQKPLPEFKPQVSWLHSKLKINLKGNPNALNDPGNKLKAAALAHPNQPIEVEGPVSGTVRHAQYNTPVGLYSGNQIVSTLVETAAARGANVPDPMAFANDNTNINTNTPTYKFIHHTDRHCNSPAQSRSIQILDAILSHPEEAARISGQK